MIDGLLIITFSVCLLVIILICLDILSNIWGDL